ncbi:MAG: polysaccharide deacetylase family protein [Clostridia bacterium]|nr:polysaccharide deacetylase family protein [Clostridia bacterium]
MKKIISILLVVVMSFFGVVQASSYVTMYSADGRQMSVYATEVELYKSVGWYESLSDIEKVVMYATDGREIEILRGDIQAYKAVGWYETKADAQPVTLYSADGREITVARGDVNAYKNVGWYENKDDAIRVIMYAVDGRQIEVGKSQVEAYKKVGWYENKSDIEKITMYAMDGREIQVIRFEVEAYKKVGWYSDKADVVSVMCTRSGKKMTVYKSQVASYIKQGWIPQQSQKIDPSKPMVALTFDDGPKASTTNKVLDVMELYNTKATFFVLGNLAVGNPTILQRMDSLNCQIGNHSYSHPNLTGLSSYNVSQQINNTSNVIYNAVGKYPTVVRPPYGSYNSYTLSAAGKPFILWSIDTLDWKNRNATSVYNAAMRNVRDGDIILMHDIYSSTSTAVESIVPDLLVRGYQLVTVDELAKYKNISLKTNNAYRYIR